MNSRILIFGNLFTRDWPKLISAGNALGIDPHEVAGRWIRWLAEKHPEFDGLTADILQIAPESPLAVTESDFDKICGFSGFSLAMAAIGFIEITPEEFVLSSVAARTSYANRLAAQADKKRRREAFEQSERERLVKKAEAAPVEKPAAKPAMQAGKPPLRKMLNRRN